ncbi:hypothetical protein KKG31_03150 [Patescibacteria group bacterium]|nr:hypothetical protein [Patescibacteria group bacterium]MBU1758155.1 hypothetical protein [Patescibacteria group bacterium]
MRKKGKAEEDLLSVKQKAEKKWRKENLQEVKEVDQDSKDVVLVVIMKKDLMEIDVVMVLRVDLELEVVHHVPQDHLPIEDQKVNHAENIILSNQNYCKIGQEI